MPRHPAHHGEGARPEDLHVDVALVHIGHVVLVGRLERLVAQRVRAPRERTLSRGARARAAERAWSRVARGQSAHDPVTRSWRSRYVAMDVEYPCAFEHLGPPSSVLAQGARAICTP